MIRVYHNIIHEAHELIQSECGAVSLGLTQHGPDGSPLAQLCPHLYRDGQVQQRSHGLL